MTVKDPIVDALDIEGFILCQDEKEARELVPQLLKEMGMTQMEIVSLEFNGLRAHVQVRAYLNKPDSQGKIPLKSLGIGSIFDFKH